MNDEPVDQQQTASDDTLAAMLKLAGPSPDIDRGIEARVYANVKQEWRRDKRQSTSVRWALPLALAASVLAGVGLYSSGVDAPSVSAVGAVSVVHGGSDNRAYSLGDTVFTNDVLDTRDHEGMSLELTRDVSLRIDANTLLRVDAANEFTLLAGRIYVDTGDRIYAEQHVTVHTVAGTATDVGTQFSVSFANADMSIAVREGKVDIREGGNTHSAKRGERVTVRPGKGAQTEEILTHGSEWTWAAALAPTFDIKSASLLEFLKWVSRETGMELNIESEAIRIEARRARLYGSIDGLSPMEALDVVLPTTQFKYSVDGNNINILR